MNNDIRSIRRKRFFRRSLRRFGQEAVGPFWHRGELLALVQAAFATYLIVQTATLARVVDELSSWWIAAQSFIVVIAIWTIICTLRAPMLVRRDEVLLGSWYDGKFIYNSPQLVATIRCKATGEPQLHKFVFEDAEPGAFVYFSVEMETKLSDDLFTAVVVGEIFWNGLDDKPGAGARRTGVRIGEDKSAQLLITMRENTVSQTVRIYAHDFAIRNPSDHDGNSGHTVRQ